MNIANCLRAGLVWSIASEPLPGEILDLLGDWHWSEVFERDGERLPASR